jgi:hypothetical protein
MRAGKVAGAIAVAVISGMLAVPAAARDDDFEDEPFSLRFPSALSRFSRYPDVAGTAGASAGAIWGSAPNPAATGWLALEGESTQFSAVDFAAGARVEVVSISPSFNIEGFGTVQPSIAKVWSNRAETRGGLDFEFGATLAEIQWARKAWQDTAVGLNLFGSTSGAEFGLGGGGATASRSRSRVLGARAGVLHQVSEPLRLGAALEYSSSRDRTTLFDLTGAGNDKRLHDTTGQFVFQPGLAFEYGKSRRIYVDYKLGILHNGDGTLRLHRLLAGIDHEFVPFLNGRAGVALDDRGNVSPTFGLGIFPSETVFIDVSWQIDMFPEVRQEFGRSNAFGIAVSIVF